MNIKSYVEEKYGSRTRLLRSHDAMHIIQKELQLDTVESQKFLIQNIHGIYRHSNSQVRSASDLPPTTLGTLAASIARTLSENTLSEPI